LDRFGKGAAATDNKIIGAKIEAREAQRIRWEGHPVGTVVHGQGVGPDSSDVAVPEFRHRGLGTVHCGVDRRIRKHSRDRQERPLRAAGHDQVIVHQRNM
jgi:hypothetical protein